MPSTVGAGESRSGTPSAAQPQVGIAGLSMPSLQFSHQPRAAPNLDVVVVEKAFYFFEGLCIGCTNQRLAAGEVPVFANKICPILCQELAP
jgi:hypothetical protein